MRLGTGRRFSAAVMASSVLTVTALVTVPGVSAQATGNAEQPVLAVTAPDEGDPDRAEPHLDLQMPASGVTCPDNGTVCEVVWDVTLKNTDVRSDAHPGLPITLTGGKLTASISREVYDVEALLEQVVRYEDDESSQSTSMSGAMSSDEGRSVVDMGAADVGTSASPTFQVISPWAENVDGDFVTREYQLPDLVPGGETTVTLRGKVDRPNSEDNDEKGLVIGNQTWVTFSEAQRDTPTLLDPALPEWSSGDGYQFGKWAGNRSCSGTEDQVTSDQCNQVYASIPAAGDVSKAQVNAADQWLITADGASSWTMSGSADPEDGQILSGTSITYSLSVTNTGDLNLPGIVLTDDLSGVIWNDKGERLATVDGCDYAEDPSGELILEQCSNLPSGMTYAEDTEENPRSATVLWEVDQGLEQTGVGHDPALKAGDGAAVSFRVNVIKGATGQSLISSVTGTLPDFYPDGTDLHPQQCDPSWFSSEGEDRERLHELGDGACTTTHYTAPGITLPMSGGRTALPFVIVALICGCAAGALWPRITRPKSAHSR